MDGTAPQPFPLVDLPALYLFLGRHAASLRRDGIDCDQECALPGDFRAGHLGIAVGVEAEHSRSVPVRDTPCFLSAGLLRMFSGAALAASPPPGAPHSWSLSGLRNPIG